MREFLGQNAKRYAVARNAAELFRNAHKAKSGFEVFLQQLISHAVRLEHLNDFSLIEIAFAKFLNAFNQQFLFIGTCEIHLFVPPVVCIIRTS